MTEQEQGAVVVPSGRRERRAYYCEDAKSKEVHRRVFLMPGETVPTCATHGKMRQQANVSYKRSGVTR